MLLCDEGMDSYISYRHGRERFPKRRWGARRVCLEDPMVIWELVGGLIQIEVNSHPISLPFGDSVQAQMPD